MHGERSLRSEDLLYRVADLVTQENYSKALRVLNTAGNDPHIRNAKGVCLLRLGKTAEATALFRSLVLNPGCTWMRPEVPTVYKTNFATALILGGHVRGALDILAEINDEPHPAVQRLRAAVRQWESQLTFWQRLNWKWGGIESADRPVQLDGAPGDFEELKPREETPRPVRPLSPRQAA